MRRSAGAFLWDMREAADLVSQFMGSATLETYLADVMLRSAVERQLQNLGEALVQLEKLSPVLAARIPQHRKIIGFRNVLVHAYTTVNHSRVWEVVGTELPTLRATLQDLLNEIGPASSDS
jgi:uncharacterized protein with HEPN domain